MRSVYALLSLCILGGGDAHAAPWNRLFAQEASSSSYLKNNWNRFSENYHPNYILDDNPKTAWVEGVEGLGEGQTLSVRVSPLSSAQAVKLKLRNGYQKSGPLLKKNAAPNKVKVRLLTEGRVVTAEKEVSLAKKKGWQEIQLTTTKGFSMVELELVSIHPGTVYKDTCISDLQIFVRSKVPYKKEAELAKRDQLKRWIKARVKAAKYFAKLPESYPFAGTHFDSESVVSFSENNEEGKLKNFVGMDQQIKKKKHSAQLSKAFTAKDFEDLDYVMKLAKQPDPSRKVRKAVVKRPIKLPDGLHPESIKAVADFLDRGRLTLFETKKKSYNANKRPKDAPWWPVKKFIRGHPLLHFNKGKLASAYLWEDKVIEERGVYTHKNHYVLWFDAQERLTRVVLYSAQSDGALFEVVNFSRSRDKIDAVTVKRASYYNEYFPENSVNVWRYAPKNKLAKN